MKVKTKYSIFALSIMLFCQFLAAPELFCQQDKITVSFSVGSANLPMKGLEDYGKYRSYWFEGYYPYHQMRKYNPHFTGSFDFQYFFKDDYSFFFETEFLSVEQSTNDMRINVNDLSMQAYTFSTGYAKYFNSTNDFEPFVDIGVSLIILSNLNNVTSRILRIGQEIDGWNGNDGSIEYFSNEVRKLDQAGFGYHISGGFKSSFTNNSFIFFRTRYRITPGMNIAGRYNNTEIKVDLTGYYFNLGFGYTF
ncbi:hypothetical protein ACFL7D_08900 [candidate division KSB1 bacterium]